MKKGLYHNSEYNVICFGMIPKKIKKHYDLIPHISVNIPKSLMSKLMNDRITKGDRTTLCLSIHEMNENQFFKTKHAFEKGITYIMFYNSRMKIKLLTEIKTFKIKSLIPKLYIYGLRRIYDTSCLK